MVNRQQYFEMSLLVLELGKMLGPDAHKFFVFSPFDGNPLDALDAESGNWEPTPEVSAAMSRALRWIDRQRDPVLAALAFGLGLGATLGTNLEKERTNAAPIPSHCVNKGKEGNNEA